MKDAYYFPHDYHARQDPKLQNVLRELGLAGLGAYWCLVEQLYEQGGSLPLADLPARLAWELRCDHQLVERLLRDFDLFELDLPGDRVTSAAVVERLRHRSERREKAQKKAQKRWSHANDMLQHSHSIAAAVPQHSHGSATAMLGKERKGKKRKDINTSNLTTNAPEGVLVEVQPLETSEVKKNEKNALSILGPFLAPLAHPRLAAAWEAFLQSRQRLRAPNSAYALNLLEGKLVKLAGHDPDRWAELLEVAVERGWRSVFEPRDGNHTTPNPNRPPNYGNRTTLNDRYAETARRLLATGTDPTL